MRTVGLTAKFGSLTFGAIFVTAVGAAVAVVQRQTQATYGELERQGNTIAQIAAANSEFAVYTGSTEALAPLLRHLDERKGTAYLRVVDTAGRVLIDRRLDPSFLGAALPSPANRDAGGAKRVSIDGFEVLDVIAPVVAGASMAELQADPLAPQAGRGRIMGWAQVGLSVTTARARINDTARSVIGATLVVLLLGLGATVVLTRRVTAPVHRLVRATQEIAAGRLDHQTQIRTGDELEILSQGFDVMVQRLRESRAEVEAQQRTLEDRVVERTRDLEKARWEAEALARRAEEASRTKSQFLANMSHEIRTPMNGVLGMLELLNGTQLSEKQQRFADTAYRSAEALLDLINDVLDFSKIEAGRLELHVEPFDLRQVVEDVCDVLAPRAQERGVDLVSLVPGPIHRAVRGDVGRFRQVLVNLVGNAIKFTPEGSVAVRVSVLEEQSDRQTIRVDVEDTGVGIPPEVRKSLFQPFVQGDSSTTRRFGGTGLGLAIARQLVELMGGTIGVESVVGRGSQFWFTLPVAKEPMPEPAESDRSALEGRRILVVDDNSTNREILSSQLEEWGVAVTAVASGRECLEQLRQSHGIRFDALVLDMHMPEMDGATVTRLVRDDPGLDGLPVVILSSAAELASPPRALEADAMLAKPIRSRELQERLTRVLIHRKPSAPAKPSDGAPAARPARVLLVEDHPTNQIVAQGTLEDLGCQVSVASDGLEAVRATEIGTFDLVFMDCMMPGMDGFEATRRIRQREEGTGKRQPIVALTAAAMSDERARCLDAGMDDYLSKPVRRHQLAEMIRRWVRAPVRIEPLLSLPASHEPTEAQRATPLIDPVAQSQIRSFPGGSRILARAVEAFLRDAPGRLGAIEAAGPGKTLDRNALRMGAHALKSGAAVIGAAGLADVCRRLEAAAASAPLTELEALIHSARSALAATEPHLARVLIPSSPVEGSVAHV